MTFAAEHHVFGVDTTPNPAPDNYCTCPLEGKRVAGTM